MTSLHEVSIGLDLGGTKFLAALVDQDGEIIEKVENTESGVAGVSERIIQVIDRLLGKSRIEKERILGAGVASAGIINSESKSIIFSSNLNVSNLKVGDLIGKHFGFPVKMANDANAAALSEYMWGAGKGSQHLVYITISTGIGAGIISDGRLVRGVGENAGEFGHIAVSGDGPLCACGNYGCLEKYASGPAIAEHYRHIVRKANSPEEIDFPITAQQVAELASRGNSIAIKSFERAGYYLGIGLTSLIHLLNPDTVVMGGGVMNASQLLFPVIKQTIYERAIVSMRDQVQLKPAKFTNDAGVLGAASLFYLEPSKTSIA